LENIKFDRELITALIGPGGILEILTIIAPSDIEKKGIPYCQAKIALIDPHTATTHAAKYAKFWAYFIKTWLKLYDIEDWNVYDLYCKHRDGQLTFEDIINRCNNPLESFNKYFGQEFSSTPTMDKFVGVIRKTSVRYVEDMKKIIAGTLAMPSRPPVKFPLMPSDYDAFVVAPVVPAGQALPVVPIVPAGQAILPAAPVVPAGQAIFPVAPVVPAGQAILPAAPLVPAGQALPAAPLVPAGQALPVAPVFPVPIALARQALVPVPFVPIAPALDAFVPFLDEVGGAARALHLPFTDFVQQDHYSSDEDQGPAFPKVAAVGEAPAAAAVAGGYVVAAPPKAQSKPKAQSNPKAQSKAKAQSNPKAQSKAKAQSNPKPQIELSFDFKPTSYRK
jgi:hypothetical protein